MPCPTYGWTNAQIPCIHLSFFSLFLMSKPSKEKAKLSEQSRVEQGKQNWACNKTGPTPTSRVRDLQINLEWIRMTKYTLKWLTGIKLIKTSKSATDRPTDGWTDVQSGVKSRVHATNNEHVTYARWSEQSRAIGEGKRCYRVWQNF